MMIDINDLHIKLRIEVFESWGYKLKKGQRMICIDHHPCEFISKRVGTYIDPDGEKYPDMTFYKVRMLDDSLYKKDKIKECFSEELHVVLPVKPKTMPNE